MKQLIFLFAVAITLLSCQKEPSYFEMSVQLVDLSGNDVTNDPNGIPAKARFTFSSKEGFKKIIIMQQGKDTLAPVESFQDPHQYVFTTEQIYNNKYTAYLYDVSGHRETFYQELIISAKEDMGMQGEFIIGFPHKEGYYPDAGVRIVRSANKNFYTIEFDHPTTPSIDPSEPFYKNTKIVESMYQAAQGKYITHEEIPWANAIKYEPLLHWITKKEDRYLVIRLSQANSLNDKNLQKKDSLETKFYWWK